jgi:hypothetical protein
MNESNIAWETTIEEWEARHRDWEVMTGQLVPLEPSASGDETVGFAVVARLREAGQELEAVGQDVSGALEHLDQQIRVAGN